MIAAIVRSTRVVAGTEIRWRKGHGGGGSKWKGTAWDV